MRALVVYESMYGNTRAIAEAIATGLGPDVAAVLPVREATPDRLSDIDLLIVGGPTHVRGMSRANTRKAAIDAARKPDSALALQPGASETGLREWFASLGNLSCQAVAFDTRINMPAIFGGRAAPRIARLLQRHGARLAAKPQSFLVDKQNRLIEGEQDRAKAWGGQLAAAPRR